MRKRVLVITVGGSPEPIINACREYEPDYIYFICSKGELPKGTEQMVDGLGNPCGDIRKKKCSECGFLVPLGDPQGKAIVVQAGIPKENYQKVVLNDPDDLEEVYAAMLQIHEDVLQRFPESKKAVNYTGGTKSMTAGAVLFGLHYPDWQLAINRGPRVDVIKVTQGDTWWVMEAGSIHANMQVEACRPLLKGYHYATVSELLKLVQRQAGLSKQTKYRIQRIRQLCQSFDAWDKFNHQEALENLEVLGGGAGKWVKTAKEIIGILPRSNPYQPVADMVLNAQRRIKQSRYDDAIARYYRAVEMLAQVRLKTKYDILTSDVSIEKVPSARVEEYAKIAAENGVIRLSLVKDYDLLDCFEDPLGVIWRERRNELLSNLEVRNNSILAHGTTPIDEKDAMKCQDFFDSFIKGGLQQCQVDCDWRQLPREDLLNL